MSRGCVILSECPCGARVRRPPEGERPVPMEHRPFCPLDRVRKCEWCGGPLNGRDSRTVCCSGACRAARWKHMHGYGHQIVPQVHTNGKSKPSGLQISYQKAARVAGVELARRLNLHEETCVAFLLEAPAMALPARQRERLGSSTVGKRKAA